VTRAIEQVAGQAEGHQVRALTGAIASRRQKMAGSGAQGWMARGHVRCKVRPPSRRHASHLQPNHRM
jgi:hypothetical protein